MSFNQPFFLLFLCPLSAGSYGHFRNGKTTTENYCMTLLFVKDLKSEALSPSFLC